MKTNEQNTQKHAPGLTDLELELLEALRKVTLEASHFLHGKRDNGTFLENELKNALAAIAKATGEGKQ